MAFPPPGRWRRCPWCPESVLDWLFHPHFSFWFNVAVDHAPKPSGFPSVFSSSIHPQCNSFVSFQIVSAYPDVTCHTINRSWDFLLLACDGIWDVLSNQEVVDFVSRRIGQGMEPEDICEELMTRCLAVDCSMGGLGCDNMTVVLVCLLHDKPYQRCVNKSRAGSEACAWGRGARSELRTRTVVVAAAELVQVLALSYEWQKMSQHRVSIGSVCPDPVPGLL